MHGTLRCFTLTIAALLIASTQGFAQTMPTPRSNTTGLMLNAHLNGSSLKAEDADMESGGGFGARVGWGFTPMVTAFIGLDAARMKSNELDANYGLGQVDIGAQLNFASSARAWRPFAEAALTGRGVAMDDVLVVDENGDVYSGKYEDSGVGFTLGGGVQYFFSAPWALSTGLSYTFGKFDNPKFDGDEISGVESWAASGARFNIGMSWYPMARR